MIILNNAEYYIKQDLSFNEEFFRQYILMCENNFQTSIKEAKNNLEKFNKEYEINGHFYDKKTHPQDEEYDTEIQYIEYNKNLIERINLRFQFLYSFRNSVVFQLFSLLESELKGFRLYHSKINNKNYSLGIKKGQSNLEKEKNYLTKSAGIEMSILEPEWSFIDDFRKLRNLIVHNDSIIKDNHIDFDSILRFSNYHFSLQNYLNPQSTVKKEAGNGSNCYIIVLDNELFLKKAVTKVFSIIDKIYTLS